MKNKFIYIFVVCAALLSGCSEGENEVVENNAPSATYEAVVDSESVNEGKAEDKSGKTDSSVSNTENMEENSVGLINPIQEVDKEEFEEKLNKKVSINDRLIEGISECQYSIINGNYIVGSMNYIYNSDAYNFRMSPIDMSGNIQDSKSLAGMYYEWDEVIPIPFYTNASAILLNKNGVGMIQWYENGYTYSISMNSGATKDKLLYMHYNIDSYYLMNLGGYEGCLDDAFFLAFYENYSQIDIDDDGIHDRVYRTITEDEKSVYTVEFGNGSNMSVVSSDYSALPIFNYIVLGKDKKEFIIYTEIYPTACGNTSFTPLIVYEKYSNKYAVCDMPFSKDINDYCFVNVGVYSEKDNKISYRCKEFDGFDSSVEVSTEDYQWANLDENERKEFVYRTCNLYRFDVDMSSSDTILFYAQVLFEDYMEICFKVHFDGTNWNIIDVYMTDN